MVKQHTQSKLDRIAHRTLAPALIVALSAPFAASPARAGAGWDAPTAQMEMRAIHDSELFPGSALSTPDKGAQLTASLDSGRRLSKNTKLGAGIEGGGLVWNRFSEASYGWAGANASVRRGGTQLRGDVEWTPHRLKFPADLEGGVFSRVESRLGVRQAVGATLRLRAEVRHQSDDFVAAFDARDGSTNEGYAQVALRANDRWTLRADALAGATRTASRKYAHADRLVGGGLAGSFGAWRFDAGVWSGLARYRDAVLGDSNFRRRDQWLQLRTEVRRQLNPSLAALAAGDWTDQNSSRLDRSYTRNTIQLGLVWTAAGK